MKILLIIAMLLSFAYTSKADGYDSFNTRLGDSEYATPVHIAGGAVAAGLAYHYAPKDWSVSKRWLVGVAAGIAAGCLSEAADLSLGNGWDNRDLSQWAVGGLISATLFKITF